jgi:hypothetical protein
VSSGIAEAASTQNRSGTTVSAEPASLFAAMRIGVPILHPDGTYRVASIARGDEILHAS